MSMHRLLFLGFLIIAGAVAGSATRTVFTYLPHGNQPAYTIVWQVTEYDATGKATPLYTETRSVFSNGNWHSVRQHIDGNRHETFAEAGRGVFMKRGQKLHYLSAHKVPPMRKGEGFLNSPNYIRTETVLGQLAIVVKPENDPDGRFEIFFAPSLNNEIKTVSHGEVTMVKEPVSLVFGEPDTEVFRTFKGLPVDYNSFNSLHGSPQK